MQDDGREVWTQVASVPIHDAGGRITAVSSVISDIDALKRASQALQQSEARLRLALGASRMGTWDRDIAGDAVHVDQACRDLLGLPAGGEPIPAALFAGLVHPDDLAGAADLLGRARTADGPTEAEVRFRRQSDGRVVWLAIHAAVVRDAAGAATRMIGVTFDVTARREAEAALAASEERYRLAMRAVNGIVYDWDVPSGRVRRTEGLREVTGYAPEDLAETVEAWTSLVHPDDLGRQRAAGDALAQGRDRYQITYRVRHRDGHWVHVEDRGLVIHDAQRRPVRVVGSSIDVTARRNAEAALAESGERLRTLTEGIPQLVWRSGNEGRWTWSSPQWQAFTGQGLEETLGLGWLDALHPDDREATMRAWEEARPHGMLDVEYRVRRAADGAYLWHHTRSLPVRDGGGRIVEWLGTTTDVQQMKELQERQGVMVAELQHRTRNLIAVVRSIAAQTMAQTGPTEAFRHEFNHRLEALARVQGLLSRAEDEPVTIEGLIRMELDALGAVDGAGGRVRLAGPPVRLRNSIVQTLALALHELATNARKHGALSRDGGSLSVTWGIREADGEGPRLVLDWAETGGETLTRTPAERRGYGRELIERALPYALGARTAYELGPEGARCTIDLPLDRGRRRRRRP